MNEEILSKDDASRAAVANENATAAYKGEDPDREALLTVRGFRFLIEEDAQAARTDLVRIEHLNRYLKSAKNTDVRTLYEKAIQNGIFSTPVGWEYLQDLRGMMTDQGLDVDSLEPIRIGFPVTKRIRHEEQVRKEQTAETPQDPPSLSLKTSIILNIVLAILVGVMFFIANTSKTDNILNYRRNVTNEYASWAEDLTRREREVRLKERELGIENAGVPVHEEDMNESSVGSRAGE